MKNYRARLLFGVSLAGISLMASCASTPQEIELPPQTLTDAPTSTVAEEAALVSSAGANPGTANPGTPDPEALRAGDRDLAVSTAPAGRRHTIVIQEAVTQEVTGQTLRQASASERERRATAEAPVAVITNSNLGELAQGGQLTIVGAPAAATSGTGSADAKTAAAGDAALPPVPTEEYWRAQALKVRLDWKAAVEDVDRLTSEVQELRRRFYEEDDPFYRDNQIKPAWDRTLDLLAEAKTTAGEHERRLERFLEEGRRAGALPGWLREGVEFEPPPTADRTPAQRRRIEDPWEPKILNEEPRDP